MPKARIITSVPEFAGGLVRDLNSRGFEVHILSPEQSSAAEVDLEIRLDASAGPSLAASGLLAGSRVPSPVSRDSRAETHAAEGDIWAMLAAFDGDVPATETALEPELPQPPAVSLPPTEELVEEPVMQNRQAQSDLQPSNQPALGAAETERQASTSAEIISEPIDAELVPSIFNLSSSPDTWDTDAANVHESAASRRTPTASLRNPNTTKAVTAVACAAMVIFALLSLVHHRQPLPAAANSSGADIQAPLPFHSAATSAATPAVMPVKADVRSSVNPAPKTMSHPASPQGDIAEDTIVRYQHSTKSRAPTADQKRDGIRYYSDLD